MKLQLSEIIEAVKDELLCYEDIGEHAAGQWEKEFLLWMKESKRAKKSVIVHNGKEYFHIKDEDEIFEIADSYMDALEEGSIKNYWKLF